MGVQYALRMWSTAFRITLTVLIYAYRFSVWLFWVVIVPGCRMLAGALIRLAARTAYLVERRAARLS